MAILIKLLFNYHVLLTCVDILGWGWFGCNVLLSQLATPHVYFQVYVFEAVYLVVTAEALSSPWKDFIHLASDGAWCILCTLACSTLQTAGQCFYAALVITDTNYPQHLNVFDRLLCSCLFFIRCMCSHAYLQCQNSLAYMIKSCTNALWILQLTSTHMLWMVFLLDVW